MNANAGAGDAAETVETLDSVYLHNALEALLQAGDPAHLYAGTEESEEAARQAYATAQVKSRRIKACRDGVLYAAIAAEAFINSFIAATLPKRDRERIDRNRTVDKYVLGPRLAVTDDLSELKQREELVVLERLFTLRNKLVHPKPRQLEEIQRLGEPAGATTSTGRRRQRSSLSPSELRRTRSPNCTTRCRSRVLRTSSC